MKRINKTLTLKPELVEALETYSKDKGFDSVSRVVERTYFDPELYQDVRKRLEATT